MTLSLRTLRLLPGEEHADRFTIPLEPLRLGGQTYEAAPAKVEATLAVQRATSGYAMRLSFDVGVQGPCMRCLEDAAVTLGVDVREYHDLDAAGDEELVSDYVADDEVQLAAWARDAIVLALPDPILCRPECAGLCASCGKNLNREPHVHGADDVDPRWAALEKLTLED